MNPIPHYTLYASIDLSTYFFLPSMSPTHYYYREPPAPYIHLQPYTPSFHLFIRDMVNSMRLTKEGQAQIARNHALLTSLKTYASIAFTPSELAAATPAVLPPPDDIYLMTALSDFDPAISPHLYSIDCPLCDGANYFQLARPRMCDHCQTKFPKHADAPAATLIARCHPI